MLASAICTKRDIGWQPGILPRSVENKEMVLGMHNRISCDGGPPIGAIFPLSFSCVKPNIDIIVESVAVEVNMRNFSILDQISHGGGVHCIWFIGHCPSNVVIGWRNFCIPPEASSEPYE
jgi:hypothetical protein